MSSADFRDYDLVLGMALLHHLEDEPAKRFLAVAASALRPGGRCLTLDACRVPGLHPIARLFIALDRGAEHRNAEGYAMLARTAFPKVEYRITHDLLRLPYTHLLIEGRTREE